ncbi:helix-turn-helix domain-containing protein [Buttiauxella sp. WJP83]|uniref:helix-turn-helix domain-containing protein n=1 Tax=Buttiauxella sp. WJP83 TaxID=2986951 RepID=UPI0022DDC0CF|nr:helix-turn-helix domain-containing protein [Buttiauxella sp. WJP83]WBM72047.1 helix-turn-helix domain-containing protein [Buttiauxella sp. WJP83]
MKKLQDVMAEFSPEDQNDIWRMAQELVLETGLQLMREELQFSQKQVAEVMGVTQPAIAAIEQRGNDLKVLTLKRYIEAMGGKLSLLVQLPEGNKVFRI